MKTPTPRAAAALVAAAAVLVYANSLPNAFALDDVAIVEQNPRVHQLSNQAAIWLTPYWPIYGQELGLYRPFAIFAFALQWTAGDGAAWLFHATSVALHAGICVLVFQLLLVLTGGTVAAFAGALIFAVHPVHVEAVANIVGQAELLAAGALLAAVLIAVRRPGDANISWPRRFALCALFFLGLLAKESVVVLPVLMVALDAVQGRIRRTGGMVPYARCIAPPLFLLAATLGAVLLLRLEVLGSILGANAAPQLPFLRGEHRVLIALRAVPEFFRLLFFPVDLSSSYAPAVINPVTAVTPGVIVGTVLLVSVAAVALLAPTASAGLAAAWFGITILPVSNLLFPVGVVVAERLLYIPSVAVGILVAYGWRELASRGAVPARLAGAVLAAVVLLLGARSAVRNPDWKNPTAALSALVRDHPESYRAQVALGNALAATDPARSRAYFEMAYRTWPDDPFLLLRLARLELAANNYSRAVALLEKARPLAPFIYQTELSLAYGYLGLGRAADASHALARAQRLGADPPTLLALHALAYELAGRLDDAAGAWRAAAHAQQSGTQYWRLLARSLARRGFTAAALAAVDTARARAATSVDGENTLAALEQAIRRGCYAAPATPAPPPRCEDPLANEILLLPGHDLPQTVDRP